MTAVVWRQCLNAVEPAFDHATDEAAVDVDERSYPLPQQALQVAKSLVEVDRHTAQWGIVQQAYQKLAMVDESVKDLLSLTPEARAHRNSQMDYGSEELARLSAIVQILSWAIEELGDVADYKVEEYTGGEAEKLEDARSTIEIWLRKEAALGDEPTVAVLEAVETLISFARNKPNAFLDGPDLGTGSEFILRVGNQLAETWPDGGRALIEAASSGWHQASQVA